MVPPPAIHPYLFAVYPVLYLYSRNLFETRPQYPLISLAVVLVGTALVDRLLRLFLRDRIKAAIAVSWFVVLCFSYGQIILGFYGMKLAGITITRGRYLLPLFLFLWAAAAAGLWRTRRRLWDLTRALNAAAAVLVLLSLGKGGQGALAYVRSGSAAEISGSLIASGEERREGLPDIFYLILDGYAGPRALREQMGFDNREFYESLRRKGFYVAQESRSNYAFTLLSLASTLNLNYLDGVPGEIRRLGLPAADHNILSRMIGENAVARRFKARGYRYIHFDSGDAATQRNRNADENLTYANLDFYGALLDMTPCVHFHRHVSAANRRRRILDTFERLAQISSGGKPAFVFAHIMLPHKPAVFGPDGEAVPPLPPGQPEIEREKKRYVGQLQFTNRKVLEFLDRLLARPGPRPIVIIHGDHGTDFSGAVYRGEGVDEAWRPSPEFFRERLSILNALLVPPKVEKLLYPAISPVNNFRALFRGLFGDPLEILEDRSFYSDHERPYAFQPVAPPSK